MKQYIIFATLLFWMPVNGEDADRLTTKKIDPLLTIENVDDVSFLSIEPGCGRYKLKSIGISADKVLYLVVERIGSPVNELGEISIGGLLGKYLIISSENEKITEIAVFDPHPRK